MPKKGISLFSVKNFLSHSAENIRRGSLLCFKKILVSKLFMHRREGASRYCRKKFVSQDRNEKLGKGTLMFFRKFLVSKKFLWVRKGEGYHDFSSEIFCLTMPKNFVRERFCVSENFGYRKVLCIRRGYHYFPLIFSVSQWRKIEMEPILVSEKFWSRNLLIKLKNRR